MGVQHKYMPRGVPNWMLGQMTRQTPPKCPRTGRFLPPSGVKKKKVDNTQHKPKPKPPKYYQPPKPKGQWVWHAAGHDDTDSD